MATFGAKLSRIAPGEVEIEMPYSDRVGQQTGLVHAGAIAAIADSACGGAAITLWPDGSDVVSIEFKVNLLAPARGERFVARAHVVRSGKTISVCAADVFAIDGTNETLIATMLGTMMRR
ncbi:MAG TPA: PaaI family thioesterase [Thermoanaerobaculia bacterium]|nr:PaaI family thioesterase [Thermoanaerobaculia bacterium]